MKNILLKFFFLDGHPQSYHIIAVTLAVLAVSVAITTNIFAEESTGTISDSLYPAATTTTNTGTTSVQRPVTTTTTTTNTGTTSVQRPVTTSCSYRYSSWGECQSNGKRQRTVTKSPSGCVETNNPIVEENCTYTASAPVACSYNYTDWGSCQSNGKRYRTVAGTSPNGCAETNRPSVEESCTYTVPFYATVVQCAFTYSVWEPCQSNGQQTRALRSKSPVDCAETTHPILSQSCTYSGSSGSSNIVSTTTAVQCVYTYSSWGACQSNGQQTRSRLSTSPEGCAESARPILSQSCTYSDRSNSLNTWSATAVAQCVYTYSSWGACQDNGKRLRSVSSKSPANCEELTQPVIEQSCVYDSTSTGVVTTSVATDISTNSGSARSTSINTNTDTSTNTSNESVTPVFSFVNVGEGMTVRGDAEIKGEVKGAKGVEFYLVPVGSNTFKYIGTAVQASGTEVGWRLSFHSVEFPNGEFYLRAKIKNAYGEYGSGQRKIFIANGNRALVEVSVSPEGFTTLGVNNEEKKQILDQFKQDTEIASEITAVTGTGTETEKLDQEKKQILDLCQKNPEKCFPDRDSDKDGLSDLDEIRYGTDPKSADTDLDGVIDGDEVKNGFDPLKYSGGDQSDKVVFEDPKAAGEVKKETYVVENVEMKEKSAGGKGLHLTGKGLPNSFVTIYIYSDPIVLTVKTDSDGNWTYELDKDLENGEHQVYVAVTDNTGKITAKSEPLSFVKTAEAATVIPSANASDQTKTMSLAQSRSQKDIFFFVAIIIAALAVAMATIGLIKHRSSEI